MFQTDLNHWLQSFETEALTFFLKSISFVGEVYPVMLICLLVIGGIHLRKGWILLNMVALTAYLTTVTKEVIDYPRPLAVDSQLKSFGQIITPIDHSELQPDGFFELFSDPLLSIIRSVDLGRHGLPSGHTSGQVAVWMGLFLLFRTRFLKMFSTFMILMTIWSRMYLGMHYLGDVLGGLALGTAVTYGIYRLSIKSEKKQVLWKYLFAAIIVLPWLALESEGNWQAALLIGANIAYLMHTHDHEYEFKKNIITQLIQSVSLVFVFLSLFISIKWMSRDLNAILQNIAMLTAGFIPLYIWILANKKLEWLLPVTKKSYG